MEKLEKVKEEELNFDAFVGGEESILIDPSLVEENLFDDLTVSEDTEVLKEQLRDVSSGIDVKDFNEFNIESSVPIDGVFEFVVEQKFLKSATGIANATSSLSKGSGGAVNITLFKKKLRLESFNQTAFSERFIPLFKEIENLDEGKEISLVFDLVILKKIAEKFLDAVIVFKYDAAIELLFVDSDNTHLEISTLNAVDFIRYKSKIGDIEYIGAVETDILQQSLKYIQMFSKKDDIKPGLSQIEVRDGQLVGGSYAALGIFESESFSKFNFKAKYELIRVLDTVMPAFNQDNTHLFESDKFYILRDENLYIGWEKPIHVFPPTNIFLNTETSADFLMIPRGDLINSLNKLSVVSSEEKAILKLIVDGSGNEATLTLITKDKSGKESKDILMIYRGLAEGREMEVFEQKENYIILKSFIALTRHFESTNIVISEVPDKVLLVEDEEKDIFKATTILAIQDMDKIKLQQESEEKIKA